ncbi:MAPEG family protein [Phreatobacter aquaticus]|uniref:MAPEG family protein n=1 Tax=Phreatobacter aquaticus TaxID=2570229 RepID=A0A4D7QSL4_9HYPH|nr:MAPEG family protein [Phreatobacter aquaticus]QCK88007.1 MAPEG family protein [Phreatobacter aquaticus]
MTYNLTALVTIAALLVYFVMGLQVGAARGRYGVKAPAVTGNEMFERLYRVQMNTLEWLPLFLAPLWLFALYVGDRYAVALGLVWIVGRVLYMLSYAKDPSKRGTGFMVQFAAVAVLTVGSLIAIVLKMI